jgi:hypothetical protein
MAATTTLLGLVTPTQGTLTGTWGDTVNYGISDYVDISVAGTLTLTNDGAVTLANTTGSSSGNSITSSLTGAGTVTAQFAIVRVTGTLTVAKVVTGPSYSKTYTVVNSATGGIVTFKASGQTGVSIAVGESAFVYYNGTDYVKLVGTATAGAAGGSNTQVQFNSSGVLAGSANMTFDGTTLTAAGFSGPHNGTVGATTATTGAFTTLSATGTITSTKDGLIFNQSATSTAIQYGTFTNTGNSMYWGLEGSAGGQLVGGSTAYDTSFRTSFNGFSFGTSAALYARLSSTGLAVTGTFSASGAITNTAGTANGVTYLNGSKVLTSGSALVFDGANLGVGGAAGSSANYSTITARGTTGGIYEFNSGGTLQSYILGNTSELRLQTQSTQAITFVPNGTEGMRLTSTGLGIGTSSPAQKLHVSVGRIAVSNGYNIGSTDGNTGMFVGTNSVLFQTNANTVATFDASGNLGLGVTPSAWNSSLRAQQFGARGAIYYDSGYYGEVGFVNNGYWAAGSADNWRYTASGGTAALYKQNQGVHSWATAPSGTAGNAITFTTAMTLDAAGGLKTLNTIGVGNATPSTSGAGITFPATQSASTDANTLDDYEEGTWTPAFGTSGTAFTSVTYSGQTGVYTKVGRLVTVSMRIEISARTVGSASGDLLITGLPFTSSNTFGFWTGSVLTNSTATNNPSVVRVTGNSTSVDLFYYSSASGTTNVPASSLSGAAEIRLTVSYIV